MITLRDVINEIDYSIMCCIESNICKANMLKSWHPHIGGLSFDRYMFGNGATDLFSYAKLLYLDETPIGYLLAYIDEREYSLRIMPNFEQYIDDIIKLVRKLYDDCEEWFIIANSLNENLCKSLINNGYRKENEIRFQGMLELNNYSIEKSEWLEERISFLTTEDIPERIKHASIPTGNMITEKMFQDYLQSNDYNNTLDYVIRDVSTNNFIGFTTWWIDQKSSTALLEPVACCEQYRRRGIIKRTLNFGLSELQKRGIQCVYVSTSINNNAAQLLYQSVGFKKTGEANKYVYTNKKF
ncbi:GNAT family N-acetyltransferase [Clostridium sp. C2-6-12]|uniref:GNAT family N-acetyltransferase n=1 Tax=Clostridium sp. C2-6-12 TaxID=2698832 RepID=UPI0013680E67|nr:GNAT family N-acetyltransferase [Clostridium sp. C2-6-12]